MHRRKEGKEKERRGEKSIYVSDGTAESPQTRIRRGSTKEIGNARVREAEGEGEEELFCAKS